MAAIADAFATSDLPIRVDVVDCASTSAAFRKIIERDRVVVQTAALLRSGVRFGRDPHGGRRHDSTLDAAELAGTCRVMISAWIKSGRCIGVTKLRSGFKLPRWQFEPAIWRMVCAPYGTEQLRSFKRGVAKAFSGFGLRPLPVNEGFAHIADLTDAHPGTC